MSLESIVREWTEAAHGALPHRPDGIFCFIAAWIALNAIYVHRYGPRIGDRAGALRFAREPASRAVHREKLDEPAYKQAVDLLANRGVMNLRSRSMVLVADVGDFEQVMSVVYQVRCNLFHGGKLPFDVRDRALVGAALEILLPQLSGKSTHDAA